jgi:ribonuclease kappa
MGVFYYIHSVALIEDLQLKEHYETIAEFYSEADKAYSQVIRKKWEIPSYTGDTNQFSILECL